MSHTAEIIAVGTELLLGNIANTDAQMLSQGLSELGLNVYYHTVVGDNPQRAKEAVAIAKKRADIIITTGGLGPTCDDLTKNVLAEAFGKKLVFDQESADPWSKTSFFPKASASTFLVRSSQVGPRPPVVMMMSARFLAMTTASLARWGLSPTTVW